MRKHAILAAVVLAAFGLTACGDEDPTDIGDDEDEIVGTWVSGGANLAPGFVPFGFDSIIATFDEDQTYDVTTYAGGSDQPASQVSGTYVTGDEPEGQIRSITLEQNAPALTAEGIFQVSGNTMRYEVIQTEPSSGATAPTVEGGFGSTVIGGAETNVWIQNYVRVSDQ